MTMNAEEVPQEAEEKRADSQTDRPPPLDDHEILIKTYDRVAEIARTVRRVAKDMGAIDLELTTIKKASVLIKANTDVLQDDVKGLRERFNRLEARVRRLENHKGSQEV